MRKKILCTVLIGVICGSCLISYAENTISELQTEHNELKNQIESASTELKDVQDELSSNLQQIQELDEKIQKAEEEIQETNSKIEELEPSIKKAEKDLRIAKKNYQKQKKLFEEKLIAMYEAGDTEYLDVILSSRGISDFLSNYYIISELATYDTGLLEDLETKKEKVEEIQENLNNQKEELVSVKNDQEEASQELQTAKKTREECIANLTDQEKEIQSKIDEYTERFAEVNKEILSIATSSGISTEYIGGKLAWPVPGYTRINSNYGMRTHPITGVYKLHTGVDIGAPMGANFIAANDGIVVKAEFNTAYGNMVIINHGGGISTLYAHGSEIVAKLGQTVKKGDVILKVGSTGYSTGAHAHFEVRKNGVTVDPLPYITNGLIPGEEN